MKGLKAFIFRPQVFFVEGFFLIKSIISPLNELLLKVTTSALCGNEAGGGHSRGLVLEENIWTLL